MKNPECANDQTGCLKCISLRAPAGCAAIPPAKGDLLRSARGGDSCRRIWTALPLTILITALLLVAAPCAVAEDNTLRVLNDTAVSLYEDGKYDEAAELAERALQIAEDAMGPSDPQLTPFLNNLAVIRYAQGKYKEAENLYEKAIRITEQAHGAGHPRLKSLGESRDRCRRKLTEQPSEKEIRAINELHKPADALSAGEPGRSPPLAAARSMQRIYAVQVGAFRDLLNAKNLQDRLGRHGYDAAVSTITTGKGEILHKVAVGEFTSRKEAELLAREILTLMGMDSIVTAK